jgi:hypothetical protein
VYRRRDCCICNIPFGHGTDDKESPGCGFGNADPELQPWNDLSKGIGDADPELQPRHDLPEGFGYADSKLQPWHDLPEVKA